jgi:glycosyltransferase involved in cell wall biosynthesis
VDALCRHLARLGNHVRVLTTNANGPSMDLEVESNRELDFEPGLTVCYCRQTVRERLSLSLLARVRSYVAWADVVHVTSVYSSPTIAALAACSALGKPAVWSPRGSLQRWENTARPVMKEAWERVCRMVAPRRVALHLTSREEEAQSLARMPGMQGVTIPNGVDFPELVGGQMLSEARRSPLGLLFVGRIHPIKGIDNLLRSCRLLGRERAWRLRVAGTGDAGYRESLEALARDLGVADRVEFLGHVDGDRKRDAYLDADVVVVPSHSENFSMTVIEALSHGRPVVASRGTPWAAVKEKGCGWWVENSPESLAGALTEAYDAPLHVMGLSGREWMRADYGWFSIARRMMDLYQALHKCATATLSAEVARQS